MTSGGVHIHAVAIAWSVQMSRLLYALIVSACVSVFAGTGNAQASELVAHVDVSEQRMVVSYGGSVLHVWDVSTGRKGFTTPRGKWKPTRMYRMWRSRKYDNAPMPYAIFFKGGYAVHGTSHVKALGRPASHGCVRLHTGNAAELYALVKQVGASNARIVITN
jgi:lipoprotein-anchoring transpeptidase ErfK/SrfK